MGKIFVTMWILFGIYILVLVMIMADLWSGIRKARSLGEVRTSYGYKRTVGKVAQYYNVLIADLDTYIQKNGERIKYSYEDSVTGYDEEGEAVRRVVRVRG